MTGIPHATVNDDVYEGYLIPKGLFSLPNGTASVYIYTACL